MPAQALQRANLPFVAIQQLPRKVETQEGTEADVIRMWIRNRAAGPQVEYLRIIRQFREVVKVPLTQLTLRDLIQFDEAMEARGISVRSRINRMTAVRSLLSFAAKLGLLQFNVGAAFSLPKAPDRLTERIMDEPSVYALIAAATTPRNKMILRVMYFTGLRAEELSNLLWRHIIPHGESGQLIVANGKGSKSRTILLPTALFVELQAFRGEAAPDAPVFSGRPGRALCTDSIWHIVKRAAERAGLSGQVSPHWLRHAHASHSLNRGAPISLVASTLGHASISTTGRYLSARANDSSALYLAG